jgi:hypothetical protein
MPLVIENSGNVPLNFASYDNPKKQIILEQGDLSCTLEYKLKYDNQFDPTNFTAQMLFHNNLSENNIFQVYEKILGERIGWIIPLSALGSNEHDYSDNPHFLRYAYVAYRKLIDSDFQTNKPAYKLNYTLEDFFPPNSAILVLNDKTRKIPDFDIDNYFPTLYFYGYYPNYVRVESTKEMRFEADQKRITLYPISTVLRDETFLKELFKNYLNVSTDDISKFHLLYQVVELLIERVFRSKLKAWLAENHEHEEAHKLREKILEISNTEKRLEILFCDYVKIERPLTELRSILLEFLDEKSDSDTPTSRLLYQARNVIFHGYRKLTPEQKALLTELNKYLDEYLVKAVATYAETT